MLKGVCVCVIYLLPIGTKSTCLEMLVLTADQPCFPDSLASRFLVRFCEWQALAEMKGRETGEEISSLLSVLTVMVSAAVVSFGPTF